MELIKNTMVIYGSEGICEVLGVKTMMVQNQEMKYYILKPVYHSDKTLYIPQNNIELKSKMRELLSIDEVNHLISSTAKESTAWISDENKRKSRFQEILSGGDRSQLLQMIKMLYLHGESRKQEGKQMYQIDQSFMREAETILYEEIAHVLSIKIDEVVPYIQNQLTN